MNLKKSSDYAILKAVHHAQAAAFYFGMAITESNARYETKDFLRRQESRVTAAVKEMKSRMQSPEAKEAMSKELEDPLMMDALNDSILMLTPENREKISDYVTEILNQQQKEQNGKDTLRMA